MEDCWLVSKGGSRWRQVAAGSRGGSSDSGGLPEMKHAGLDDEAEEILEGLERRIEPLGQRRVLGVAHIVVQDLGELPEGAEPQLEGGLGEV